MLSDQNLLRWHDGSRVQRSDLCSIRSVGWLKAVNPLSGQEVRLPAVVGLSLVAMTEPMCSLAD